MKHFPVKPLCLALALSMLFALVLPARAAENDDAAYSASVEDIIIKPKRVDGHVNFGLSGDVEALSFRGADKKDISVAAASVQEAFAQACKRRFETLLKGVQLDYISTLNLDANQGTIYNGYNTEGDTGEGVAGVLKYYYSDTDPSNYHISDIRFVPKSAFNGQALISYNGYYHYTETDEFGKEVVKNGSYSGRLYIVVDKQEPGIAYATDGEPAHFLSDDFNAYSLAVTGRAFNYITFRLPSAAEGTLYYNYIEPKTGLYDYAVTPGSRYYRVTSPTVNKVAFVPAKDYEGNVHIEFTGVDTAGAEIRGEILIKVTAHGPGHTQPSAEGPFVYKVAAGRPVSLDRTDFVKATIEALGAGTDFLCFSLASLPKASEGVLYDDGSSYYSGYYGPSSSAHYASVGKDYYYPDNLRFVAATGYSGVVSMPIVVTASNGEHFDSMLRFVVSGGSGERFHYYVEPERRVSLIGSDFSDACYAQFGFDVSRVHFTTLPHPSTGTLYYNGNAPVTTLYNDDYYKSQLDNLSFLANAGFIGDVTFQFTAYAADYTRYNNHALNGRITITSTSVVEVRPTIGGTAKLITFESNGTAVPLDASKIIDAVGKTLSGTLTTIRFDQPGEGHLYRDFSSLTSYTEATTGNTYPIGEVSRISYIPGADFSGTERISYTVTDSSGNSYGGNIEFKVTQPTVSRYFSDMGGNKWAVPAVDFFRHYGIVLGNSPTGFGPNGEMKRGDFVLLLDRLFGFPEVWTSESFDDVTRGVYYAEALAKAKELGIITGTPVLVEVTPAPAQTPPEDAEAQPDGAEPIVPEPVYEERLLFDPNGAITREEAALFLYRALRWSNSGLQNGSADDLAPFRDRADVSPRAVTAMGTLVRMCVFKGDYGHLYPDKPLTRAQAVAILYRALT
ncbi:MAG: S-layer homology domain-containing protein [Oscillospiraceae bacterium]|nr:S-layer homology domain-containing protein [Oscillospiraceae bacterium]